MSTPGKFAPAPPPQKSSGTSILVIILIIGGVILLVCGGLCAGCTIFATRVASEAGAALELTPIEIAATGAVVTDQQVKDKLGEPIDQTSLFARDGKGELKAGGETFHFDLKGPKSTAKVLCTAKKQTGTWTLTVITVQFADGTTITVPPPAASGPDVQFEAPAPPEEKVK